MSLTNPAEMVARFLSHETAELVAGSYCFRLHVGTLQASCFHFFPRWKKPACGKGGARIRPEVMENIAVYPAGHRLRSSFPHGGLVEFSCDSDDFPGVAGPVVVGHALVVQHQRSLAKLTPLPQ